MNRKAIAVSLLMSLAAAVQASAADIKVDCAKGQSINDALARLKKSGPNVVTVSGTCAEDIVIEGFDDLELVADPGAVLTPASPGSRTIMLVNSSRQVVIDGFSFAIEGTFTWVIEFNGSFGCRVTNVAVSGGGGIRLQRSSQVVLSDSTIRDGSIGVIVGNACQADIRGVTVENTLVPGGQIGIAVFVGSTAFVEGTVVRGFAQGVLVGSGGSFFVPGPGFFDTNRVVVIENNRIGVSASGGLAQFSGPVRIVNNGNGSNFSGGVIVTNGSLAVNAFNFPAEISDNNGQGVLVTNLGVARITGPQAMVVDNDLNGVAVVNGGVVEFSQGPVTVTGSAAKDIFCDERSLVTGVVSVTGATSVQCTTASPQLPRP